MRRARRSRRQHFRYSLDSGYELVAYTAGKMRDYRINIPVSAYDLTRGRHIVLPPQVTVRSMSEGAGGASGSRTGIRTCRL